VTGAEVREARATLGELWGFGRPLHRAELGRALRLTNRDPGETVATWEGSKGPSGPASVAIALFLAGALPPDGVAAVRGG
jgi:hypothetical protein